MSRALREIQRHRAAEDRQARLSAAIDRLAGLIEGGALMAATDPAALLLAAADRIASAWTPGPPTEPGEWDVTMMDDDGELFVFALKCSSLEILWGMRPVLAHRPRPEPYRG